MSKTARAGARSGPSLEPSSPETVGRGEEQGAQAGQGYQKGENTLLKGGRIGGWWTGARNPHQP